MFVPGLVLGSASFRAWHLAIGYAGGAALAAINLPVPVIVAIVIAVIALGIAGWVGVRRMARRRGAAAAEAAEPDGYAAWADASCPACITISLLRERQALNTQAGKT